MKTLVIRMEFKSVPQDLDFVHISVSDLNSELKRNYVLRTRTLVDSKIVSLSDIPLKQSPDWKLIYSMELV